MYLEEDNVDYDLLRDAVCESKDATTKPTSFQMNCPLKSCRSCIAAGVSSTQNSVPTAQAINGDIYNQEEPDYYSHGVKTSKPIQTQRCNKKCCNVGRNSKKRPLIRLPKINLIDFTKINRKRNMKMCMKTKLVDGGNSDGSDYVPLLITSTDDLVLPLNAEESNVGSKKKSVFFARRLNRETLAHFLDTLTRTFCLPLLG